MAVAFWEQTNAIIYNLLIGISSLALEKTLSEDILKLGGATYLCSLICSLKSLTMAEDDEYPKDLAEGITASIWNLALVDSVKRYILTPSLSSIDTKLLIEKLIILSNSKFANIKKNAANIIQILSSKTFDEDASDVAQNGSTPRKTQDGDQSL